MAAGRLARIAKRPLAGRSFHHADATARRRASMTQDEDGGERSGRQERPGPRATAMPAFAPHPARDLVLGEIHARPFHPVTSTRTFLRYGFQVDDAGAVHAGNATRKLRCEPPELVVIRDAFTGGDARAQMARAQLGDGEIHVGD